LEKINGFAEFDKINILKKYQHKLGVQKERMSESLEKRLEQKQNKPK
jgi:hypothetical protein